MAAIFTKSVIWYNRFSERGKKVHFWKSQFQKGFLKSKFSNFAAIFVYMEFMNGSKIWWKNVLEYVEQNG